MKYSKIFLITTIISMIFFFNAGIGFGKKAVKKVRPQTQNLNFQYYNEFPGEQELNLFGIERQREITGIGVISPDMEKVAYSQVYFYPQNKQTSSTIFYINASVDEVNNLNVTLSPSQLAKIFDIQKPDNPGKPIIESGTDGMDTEIFRTLTIIDWSVDSRRLLVKETVGEHFRGIWATNLWVYDFDIKKVRKIDEVRKAIMYYWKGKYDLHLRDYRWDIVPLGWDAKKPDMIVVNAYGYNNDGKEFLGCWGIDFRGRRTQLLSLDNEEWAVAKNGLVVSGR